MKTYLYLLWLYAGLAGAVLLLGLASISRLSRLRNRGSHGPLVAASCTLLTLLWLLLPPQGRWMLSTWSPGAVLEGWMVLDMQFAIWWLGIVMGGALSSVLWVEVSERQSVPSASRRPASLPLTGALLVLFLLAMGITFASGSLLLTLAMWAVLDILWFVAALMAGMDGERVVLGLAVQGVSSLLLWMVSLFMLEGGGSSLWWLMRPSMPLALLLVVAAFMRLGFYPFHIVMAEGAEGLHSLAAIYTLGPLAGVILLYRLLSMPGGLPLPEWVVGWGALSVFWASVRAWIGSRRPVQYLSWVSWAALLAIVTAALASAIFQLPVTFPLSAPAQMVLAVAVWLAASHAVILTRGYDRRHPAWSWPAWMAGLLLLGVPLSPLAHAYATFLLALPWGWRLVGLLGLVALAAALLRGLRARAPGRAAFPWATLRASRVVGITLLTVLMLGGVGLYGVRGLAWWYFPLWGAACFAGAALVRWEAIIAGLRRRLQPLVAALDLQWFYRALWEGAENMLGIVRAAANVVEGSGSLLWSVVIVLLVLMILGAQ